MRKATVFKTTLLLFLLSQAWPAAFAQQDETTRTITVGQAALASRTSLAANATYLDERVVTGGDFTVTNNSDAGVLIASLTLDLKPGLIFDTDPVDGYGFKFRRGSRKATGASLAGERVRSDMTSLTIVFSSFEPGDTLHFSVDVDLSGSGVVGGDGFAGSALSIDFFDGFSSRTLSGTYAETGSLIAEVTVSAAAPTAQAQEKTRSTPYRIGVFPFADFSPWGSYSEIEQIKDETADVLQTFVDGHPSLVLTYSYVRPHVERAPST